MIYYECYHISKYYNFKMKLNYIFNNMEHQVVVMLVVVRVTMTAVLSSFEQDSWPKQFTSTSFVTTLTSSLTSKEQQFMMFNEFVNDEL
jgi:hypothetical protein